MRSIEVAILSLGVAIVAACSGPESTGIPNAGGRRSFGGGGSAGDLAGTLDPTGTGGDLSGTGGDLSGAGGIDMGDAQANDPADVIDAGHDDAPGSVRDGDVVDSGSADVSRDATASDAPGGASDVNAKDVITTADCNATPSQDFQCRSSRTPHRYVCPLSLGTPTGCTLLSTGSTSAAYCCP